MLSCGILTVSDSCFRNEREDKAGPLLESAIEKHLPEFSVRWKSIVPDDVTAIKDTLNEWVDGKCNVILTSGGTGFSHRDVTPEATRAVIEREAPGLSYAMIGHSLTVTPMAMLSRAVCGIKSDSIVINLPGSAKGALECFHVVKECLRHAVDLVRGDDVRIARDHVEIQRNVRKTTGSLVALDNVAGRPRKSTYPLVEVDRALEIILKELTEFPEEIEEISLEKALGRVLAQNITAKEPVPPFDASIKDGYAVRHCDGSGLRKIRHVLAAGDQPNPDTLGPGEAIRIGTGAPIPPGADAVVQVEDTVVVTQRLGEEIEVNINVTPTLGQEIRSVGCDVPQNSTVFAKGERLDPSKVGVLAALGQATLKVYKKPTVGIVTTGNELKNYNEELRLGQIRDSNRPFLINLLKEYHYPPEDFGIVPDNPTRIKNAIESLLDRNDVIITTGGVSMGEFDFIKRVLSEDFSANIHFGRVNMKPGKPTTFATLLHKERKKLIFGLPGNPASAGVTALLFVIPVLRLMEKCTIWQFPRLPYMTCSTSTDPRPDYQRVSVKIGPDGNLVAEPTGSQLSSRLNSLVNANGLLIKRNTDGLLQPTEIILVKELQQ